MKYNKRMFLDRHDPDDFVLFWGHRFSDRMNPGKACLSNFFPADMVIEDQHYSCVEQYMHAQKAELFGDTEIAKRIRLTSDPSLMKQLGREVRGYKEKVWRAAAPGVVMDGAYAKFSQNSIIREFLLSTGSRILVEASPYDTRWGIGMRSSDTRATAPALWRGDNWLGFILMEVRDRLREEGK